MQLGKFKGARGIFKDPSIHMVFCANDLEFALPKFLKKFHDGDDISYGRRYSASVVDKEQVTVAWMLK